MNTVSGENPMTRARPTLHPETQAVGSDSNPSTAVKTLFSTPPQACHFGYFY